MAVAQFDVNFAGHSGQLEVSKGISENPQANIITIDCSRGWGKTIYTVCDLVIPHAIKKKNAQIMWVAPTYKICKAPIDDVFYGTDDDTDKRFVTEICPETGYRFWEYRRGDMELEFYNGSTIFFRSADNPDSIVAKGYSLIVIDEAALIPEDVFNLQILATARRGNCKIVLISTPRGKNWFYHKYLDGQDKSKPQYISFKQPWYKRPDYPQVLVDLMNDIPDHIRRQEFFADFIADGGGTFTNLEEIFTGNEISFESDQQEWRKPVDAKRLDEENFVVSVDIAKAIDYTVITVISMEKRDLVYYKRMNKKDYKLVIKEMDRVSADYNYADIIYDATGVGAGLQDFILNANAHPFKFTNESKSDIVTKLIVACDYGNIHIPNIKTIRNEFELFQYQLTRTGKMTYSAPAGRHDDVVISLAMAVWYAEENSGAADINEIDNFLSVVQQQPEASGFHQFMLDDND